MISLSSETLINYIHSQYQTEEMQLAAIKHNHDSFRYITKPTNNVVNEFFKLYPDEWARIPYHCFSDEIIIKILQMNLSGEQIQTIQVILKKRPHLLDLAVKYYPELDINNPNITQEELLKAVSKNGGLLSKINNLSTEIVIAAIKERPFVVNSIKNPTTDMKQLAISLNPDVIRYMKRPTEKLQLLAIKQNPNLINYIKKPTEKIILLALQKLNYPADLIMKYIFSGQLSEKSINLLYNEIIARDIINIHVLISIQMVLQPIVNILIQMFQISTTSSIQKNNL